MAVQSSKIRPKKKEKKILVSGNAGDEKNLHPGGRKVIFLIDFPEIFSFLLYFLLLFLYSYFFMFFACLFVFRNWKHIFWFTLDYAGGWVKKKFSPGRIPGTRLLFVGLILINSIVSKFWLTMIKNWINHESKKFRYEGLLLSWKHRKVPNFVVRCSFSTF